METMAEGVGGNVCASFLSSLLNKLNYIFAFFIKSFCENCLLFLFAKWLVFLFNDVLSILTLKNVYHHHYNERKQM
jgi:hypothetical protein